MIDFRYHLVSIVAVFLALAVGLALGTTMLQDPLLNALKSETADLREQSDDLRADMERSEELNEGADAMSAAVADEVLAGRLDGRDVVLLASPGADEEVADGLAARIEQAGGTVGGRVAFTEAYLDPDRSGFIDELTLQLSEGAEPDGGTPYERAGWALAGAVAAEEGAASAGEAADGVDPEAVLAGFAEAELLSVEGEPAGAADVAVVLAPAAPFPGQGGPSPDEDGDRPGNVSVMALADALESALGGAAVLAGGATAAGPGGVITQARAADAAYTTVDLAGRPTGDVASALAVAAAAAGDGGHFGTGEHTEGFVPDPLPERSGTGEREESESRTPEGRP